MIGKVVVVLDQLQASCLAACARLPIQAGISGLDIASMVATVETAKEGAEVLEAALVMHHEEPTVDLRQTAYASQRNANNALWIDSGWDAQGVTLDFHTRRGAVVTLSVQEWRDMISKVEQIIANCEYRRTHSNITHSVTGHSVRSWEGSRG